MSDIEAQVVRMEFDNSNFEKNVKKSRKSISQLRNELDFTKTAKALNKNFNSSEKGIDSNIKSINKSLELTAGKIIRITTIANLTNSIFNRLKSTIKSLSFDNILSGFSKYEESTKATATLLAQTIKMTQDDGTVKTIENVAEKTEIVTEQMKKLNWYTDNTSYSFTEMQKNIGKFTAAGLSLNKSEEAMEGIANWAAASGQNAEVASRAMYNISQAMSSGSMRLVDYKSIQNASMDTTEFRQKALDAAVAAGKLTKNIDGTYNTLNGHTFNINNFTDYLSDKWLDKDVMMDTLGSYSKATTEIYNMQKKLGADGHLVTISETVEEYEKHIEELKAAYESSGSAADKSAYETAVFGLKVFKSAQEARTLSDALNATKDAVSTGWKNTFETFIGLSSESTEVFTILADRLTTFFNRKADNRNNALTAWASSSIPILKEVDGELKEVNINARDLLFADTSETKGAVWQILDSIGTIIRTIEGAFREVFPYTEGVSDEVEGLTQRMQRFSKLFYNFANNLSNVINKNKETISTIFKVIFGGLKILITAIKAVFTIVKPFISLIGSIFSFITGKLNRGTSSVVDGINSICNWITNLSYRLQSFNEKIVNKLYIGITWAINKVILGLQKLKNSGFIDFIKKATNKLVEYIIILKNNIVNLIKKIDWNSKWNSIKKFFSKLWSLIVSFWNKLKSLGFVNIIKAIGAGIWKGFKFIIDSFKQLATGIKQSKVGQAIDGTIHKIKPLEIFVNGIKNLFKGALNFIKGLLSMFGSLFTTLGTLLGELGNGMQRLFQGGLTTEEFNRIKSGVTKGGIIALIGVLIYQIGKAVGPLIKLARILGKSIGDIMNAFTDGLRSVFKAKAVQMYAVAIKEMSKSILIMVASLIVLSSIDEQRLENGLKAMTVVASTMVIFVKLIVRCVNSMQTVKSSVSKLFVGFKSLSKSSTKGLSFVNSELAEKAKMIGAISKLLVRLSVSMFIMALVIKKLGSIDPKVLTQGLEAMIVMLSMTAIFVKASASNSKDDTKNAKKTAKTLAGLGIAVLLMSRAITKLGSLDEKQLKQGLLGLGAIFGFMASFFKLTKNKEKRSGSNFKKNIQNVTDANLQLMGLATASILLTATVKILGKADSRVLAKGLLSTAVLFSILAMYTRLTTVSDSKISKESKSGKNSSLSTNKEKVYHNVSASIKGLAVGMLILTGSVAILGNMNTDTLKKGLISIGIITGTLIAYSVLTSKADKELSSSSSATKSSSTENSKKTYKAINAKLVGLSMAAVILAGSIKILSTIDDNKLKLATGMVAGIIAAMGVFTVMITKYNKDTSKTTSKTSSSSKKQVATLKGVAKALISTGIAMVAVAGAFKIMDSVEIDKIQAGTKVLAVMLAGISAITFVLSKSKLTAKEMNKSATSIIKLAIAVAILASSTIPMAAAMKQFSEVSGKDILKGVASMIAFGVACAGLALVLKAANVDKIVIAIGKAFMYLGAGLALVSVSILLLVAAAAMIAPAMQDLAENAEYAEKAGQSFGLFLSGLLNGLSGAVSSLLSLISQAIDETVNKIFISLQNILSQLWTFIQSNTDSIAQTIVNFVNAVLIAINNSDLLDNLVVFIIKLCRAVLDGAYVIIDDLVTWVIGLVNKLAERLPEIGTAIGNLVAGIVDAFFNALEVAIPKILNRILDFICNLCISIGNFIMQAAGRLKAAFSYLKMSIVNAFDTWFGLPLKYSAEDLGKTADTALGDGITNNSDITEKAGTAMTNTLSLSIKNGLSALNPFNLAKKLVQDFFNGMSNKINALKEKIKDTWGKITSWIKGVFGQHSPSKVFEQIGEYNVQGYMIGVDNEASALESQSKGMATSLIEAMDEIRSTIIETLNGMFNGDGVTMKITPVLDTTILKDQISALNQNGLRTSISANAVNAAEAVGDSGNTVNHNSALTSSYNTNNTTNNNNSYNYEVNFYITNPNTDEVADKVNSVMQKVVERNNANNGNTHF